MRSSTLTLLLLGILELALACCGNSGITSCCGNGKCNIFCCNCNGGCNKSCKPEDPPICWAWAGGHICTGGSNKRDLSIPATATMYTPRSIDELPGYNIAARAQSEEDEAMFKVVDADSKGYFTFDEFLRYTNESHTIDVAEYFNKFDLNGDGVITLNEMRLSEEI